MPTPKPIDVEAVLIELLESLANARDFDDVNIAAGIAAQSLTGKDA